MQDAAVPTGPMTIEDFLTFYEQRPQGEKWELIEGVPVMGPSATDWHQVIAGNIIAALANAKLRDGGTWVPALGMRTRVPVSPNSLPEPDVMVFEHPLRTRRRPTTSDALVLFEVLSESNTRKDQAWRRKVYASVPNCRHYVTVDSRRLAVARHDAPDWADAKALRRLDELLALPALGIAFSLAEIYRWTPLGDRSA